jgi:alkylated DNA nucleotide flippase Atl1
VEPRVQTAGGARTAGAGCLPAGRAVPWHRVPAAGLLLLTEPRVWLQKRLLEAEGLHFADRRIADFASCEWSPRKAGKSRRRRDSPSRANVL